MLSEVTTYDLCNIHYKYDTESTDIIGLTFSYDSSIMGNKVNCEITYLDYILKAKVNLELNKTYENHDILIILCLTEELREFFANYTNRTGINIELNSTYLSIELKTVGCLDNSIKLIDKLILKIYHTFSKLNKDEDELSEYTMYKKLLDCCIMNNTDIISYPGLHNINGVYYYINDYSIEKPYAWFLSSPYLYMKYPHIYSYNPNYGMIQYDGNNIEYGWYIINNTTIRFIQNNREDIENNYFVLTSNMIKILKKNGIILVNNKYGLILRDKDFQETLDEQILDMIESGVPGIYDIERVDIFNITTSEYIPLGYMPCEYNEFIFSNSYGENFKHRTLISLHK